MKRLLVSLVVAVLAVGAFAGVGVATHSNGEGPDKDFANGTLKGPLSTPFGTFPSQTHINAWSTDPVNGVGQGHFYTRIFTGAFLGTVTISGDIVCITAFGNRDINRGVVTESSTTLVAPGAGVIGSQEDNGEGANDPPDESTGFLTGPPPSSCPQLNIPGAPQAQGNVTIHDGI